MTLFTLVKKVRHWYRYHRRQRISTRRESLRWAFWMTTGKWPPKHVVIHRNGQPVMRPKEW